MCYVDTYSSPLGTITLSSDGTSLTGCWFEGQKHFGRTLSGVCETRALGIFDDAKRWLDVYFRGEEPLILPCLSFSRGATVFEQKVWQALLEIPYGTTRTYKDVAQKTGGATYCRAAAGAIGRNPLTLFVPCHRVIGSDGSLTGYAGGLDRKAWLLHLEAGGTGGKSKVSYR